MKNIKTLIIIVLSAFVLNSCSGFLDSEPLTTLTDGNFYKTRADAELAIVGCYDGVQAIYNGGIPFPLISEVASDNCFGGTGNADGYGYQLIDEFDLNRSPSDESQLNGNWVNYYAAIYRMNMLLSKMDQIDWKGDDAYRTNIEAQARFLRAFCYFDMVRLWEKVPLLTEPKSGNIPQSGADEIYAAIADDLMFTAQNGSSSVEPGRVNKYAAKALLARVFLFYTGYYAQSDLVGKVTKTQALQGLEDIIGSGEYGLITYYQDLWPGSATYIDIGGESLGTTYAGKDNNETIFAIKYNITSNYNGNSDGNQWMIMLGLRGGTYPPYAKGWGGCTVVPSLYSAFESGDTRRSASIIGITEENIEYDNHDDRDYTGYSVKKYTPIANPDGQDVSVANGASNFMIGQFQDFVVMRYADVLLMAAELGSTSAQDYFDQVRERAGLGSIAVNTANIMNERRFEFAFEGIRYWDLLRQGVNLTANTIALNTNVLNGGVSASKVISTANIIAKKGLQMIPQQQITRSGGVLVQNAGW